MPTASKPKRDLSAVGGEHYDQSSSWLDVYQDTRED